MTKTAARIAFFDVGGTLGSVDAAGKLNAFPDSSACLASLRETLGMRIGIISNTPATMDAEALWDLLASAGLTTSIEKALVVTSTDAHADKPADKIYRFAAERAGVPPEACLYVGESREEVDGAIKAGMGGILKPARS